MRLIDADSFLKDIKGWQEDIQDNEYDANKFDFVFERIYEMFEEIPTAYSVDNVVEELEKAKHEIASEDYCRSINDKEKCNGRNCFECCAEYLIEIVKDGGVSDDVREWINYDYRTICPKDHDANNPYWRIPDNTDKLKYCPYCGKKIKVVD